MGSTKGLLPEYRKIDGTGNNLLVDDYNPYSTAEEVRMTDFYYGDPGNRDMIGGTNPRTISNIMSSGPQKDDHDPRGVSGWGYVFGQFVDHDLDLTPGDGVNNISVQVPNGDPWLADGTLIPMTRAIYNPDTGMTFNNVTGWLDGSQIYGSDWDTAANLRLPDGHMKTSDDGYLPIQDGVFIAGDVRVMENPELTGSTMLFVREHNYQVDRLAKEHPSWTGDQLYNQAKAIVTAELQNIVYTQFLPAILGNNAMTSYHGYDPNVDPRITQEFAFGAFRFGHSTVSDEQSRIDNQGNLLFDESLADAFLNSNIDADHANGGLDALLRNLGSDIEQAVDPYAVDGLRNLLTAPPAAVDLIATDIQRERDIGLGTLNQTRVKMGLTPYTSFSQISSDQAVVNGLQQAYGSVDDIDLFMGGLAENIAPGMGMGETFTRIIAKQFENLRDGDRFWWQNQPFDAATASMIANSSLSNLIMRNTDTLDMQKNAFFSAERHLSDVAPEDPNGPQLVIGIEANGAFIAGGPSDDTIVAGIGHDQTLTGNGGSDLFVIDGSGHSNVMISDFDTSFDQIEFHGDAPTGQPVQMRDVSGGTQLTFNGNTVTLAGVDKSGLGSKNFVFLDDNAEFTSHGLVPPMA